MRTLVVCLAVFATLGFADILLMETFDSPWTPQSPPAGWTIIYDTLNPKGYCDWHREGANAAPWSDHPSPYPAIFWQPNPNQAPDAFVSPMIDCSNFRNVVLYCSTYFYHKLDNPYVAQIRYSIDGGNTFPYLLRDYHGQNVGPGVLESLELTYAARQDSVVIMWIYDGNLFDINWWFFDDVVVTGESIPKYDIECSEIVEPHLYELPGGFVPHARFQNIGLLDQVNVPVVCSLFDNVGNPVQGWIDTIPNLPSYGGEQLVYFDSISILLTPGDYTIRYWSAADSDYIRSNDTLERNFTVSNLEEIANDDGTPARYLSYPVGHYGWAAKFSTTGPVYIESVRVFLNAPTNPNHCRYQLAVALDDGAGNPGPFIYKSPVLYATPGTSGWNSVFLADIGEYIVVPNEFYLFYLQVGEPPECPQLGADNSLNNPSAYWEFHRGGTVTPYTPPGDLMLRAIVNHSTLTPSANDVRVTFIEQPLYEFIQRPFDAPCPITAHIHNFGTNTLYYVPVVCSVFDPANALLYYDSVNIAQINPNEEIGVSFNTWVPIVGQTCSIIVRTLASPDDVPQNDDKRFTVDVLKGAYTGRHPAGYAWIDSDTTDGPVYDWIDTTGFNVVFSRGDDDRLFVPLGFKFRWSDTTYDNCYVTTNGWLSLGPDPHTATPNPKRLPIDSLPNAGIYPWWCDFVLTSASRVYYKTIGEMPNRKFVVIWHNVNVKGTDTTNLVSFEAILNENGTIVFQYKDVETGSLVYDQGKNASIGVENKEGTAGLNYLYSLPPMSLAVNDPANRLTSGRAIKLYREFRDAAALEIVKPEYNVFPVPLNPEVRIQNYGTVGDSIMVYLSITPGTYLESLLVTGLRPERETLLTFPAPWSGRGNFTAVCSVAMTGDINPANNFVIKNIFASAWVQREDIPIGPQRKKVKDASLVYASTTNKLYALKGGNSNEFYCYDPATGTWDSLSRMPLAPSGKKPKDGCDLVFDPFQGTNGGIWAIKGGGTGDFYLYDIALDSWIIKPNVRVEGFSFRPPKRGAALAYVPTQGANGTVYCATGSNTLTFLRFDVARDSWFRCPDVPYNPGNRKTCRFGTDMVYDGDSIIYLLKGSNSTEVWKYRPALDVWHTIPLDEVTLIGTRNRRVKNGGAITFLDNNLYVLKGGNCQEFWSYQIGGGNVWVQRSDIPFSITGKRRKPKRGAALAATSDAIFCLKGSMVYEFWEYRPETDSFLLTGSVPPREGVMAENTKLPNELTLTVYPNPTSRGNLQISYTLPSSGQVQIKVYDATGTLIRTLIDGTIASGRHNIIWDRRTNKGRVAPAGVYFVKMRSGKNILSEKVIIQD
ncbi:MAG: T9SS type A sorting domain-containing protein [candidate division WOR-3 bacterium]